MYDASIKILMAIDSYDKIKFKFKNEKQISNA